MPHTPDQWLWFWFFAGGAAGGWVVLIGALCVALRFAVLFRRLSILKGNIDHANSHLAP